MLLTQSKGGSSICSTASPQGTPDFLHPPSHWHSMCKFGGGGLLALSSPRPPFPALSLPSRVPGSPALSAPSQHICHRAFAPAFCQCAFLSSSHRPGFSSVRRSDTCSSTPCSAALQPPRPANDLNALKIGTQDEAVQMWLEHWKRGWGERLVSNEVLEH